MAFWVDLHQPVFSVVHALVGEKLQSIDDDVWDDLFVFFLSRMCCLLLLSYSVGSVW